MSPFRPSIAPEIFALRPDFCAASILAIDVANAPEHQETAAALAAACQEPCSESWADAHRESWREAYRSFDAKPQRTPCSAEALLKRAIRDSSLPGVNAIVDLYNAVSLRFAIPVGGENADAYLGPPRLMRAKGDESFETMQSGTPVLEKPEVGEVIWRDDKGVTCRRWNWRQGSRTRIEPSTRNMWFILEALDPMPVESLRLAAAELMRGIAGISPSARFEAEIMDRSGSRPMDI